MVTSLFVCQQCGNEFAKWFGKCPACGEWNSLVETAVLTKFKIQKSKVKSISQKPKVLASIKVSKSSRISTKIPELDRVLGGGIVPGQVILVAGEPGIGKSTILLQLADKLGNVLYISGEESAQQIAIRAKRLGVRNKTIQILEETDIDSITQNSNVKSQKLIVVDSIQTMTTTDLSGMAGSVGQVRESAARLVRLAKSTGIPVAMVGHVTKEGSVAGPATLAHIVDTVCWFEGDRQTSLRLVRAVKNRFGPTDEVGIFAMGEVGLVAADDTKIFVSKVRKAVSGSCIASVMEGTRPILVEIQSLIVPTRLAFPRRTVQGIDVKRVEMILAVLARRASVPVNEFDVIINVVGGLKLKEPGADLAIALSIASSYSDKALPKDLLAVGEIGLLGEVRPATSEEKRIREARRMGYRQIASSREFNYLSQVIHNFLGRYKKLTNQV